MTLQSTSLLAVGALLPFASPLLVSYLVAERIVIVGPSSVRVLGMYIQ